MKTTSTITRISVAGLAALLSACIPSLQPFYEARDRAFDPDLVGPWEVRDTDGEFVRLTFEAAKDGAYKLTFEEKEGKKGEFKAVLFNLGGRQFLDLIPSECKFASDQADLVAFAVFPGHLLVQVTEKQSTLELAFMDYEWLSKHIEANPKALAYLESEDRVLLTARTRALQAFIRKHMGQGELFQKPAVYTRASR